jgi:quinol monooxygenase YgiN
MTADTTVTVLAIIKVKAGSENDARALLASIVADTLEEPGCLVYDLHQSASDPTEFLFYERWASDAALDAHSTSSAPHRLKLRDQLGPLVDGRPSVTRWRRTA